jgi:hypothetical protein
MKLRNQRGAERVALRAYPVDLGGGCLFGERGEGGVYRLDRALARLTQTMTAGKPVRVVIRDPNGAVLVLPDERLERKIDAALLPILHKRRATPWTAENKQLRRPQLHPHGRCRRRMIYKREDVHTCCDDCGSQAIERLGNRKPASNPLKSVFVHSNSPRRSQSAAFIETPGAIVRP